MNNKEISKPQKKTIYWIYKHDYNKFNPVNKSIFELIERNKKKNEEYIENHLNDSNLLKSVPIEIESQITSNNQNQKANEFAVSVITCTNRKNYFANIFTNFKRQRFEEKELIIILNSNRLDLNRWKNNAKDADNIKIYQLDEKISLGECLNYAIDRSKYDIIAKFDDDDYYGADYLTQAVNTMKRNNAHVVGKSTSYVYFENKKTLAVRNPGRENRFIYRVEGPTLVFKKQICNDIRFSDKNLGEDVKFCKDCCRNGFKIFSTDKQNFVYIRHDKRSLHTWAIKDDYYLKLCNVIGQMEDFSNYVS